MKYEPTMEMSKLRIKDIWVKDGSLCRIVRCGEKPFVSNGETKTVSSIVEHMDNGIRKYVVLTSSEQIICTVEPSNVVYVHYFDK